MSMPQSSPIKNLITADSMLSAWFFLWIRSTYFCAAVKTSCLEFFEWIDWRVLRMADFSPLVTSARVS